MGIEVEDYAACWMEITGDGPSSPPSKTQDNSELKLESHLN
jgi:hypothetical protein